MCLHDSTSRSVRLLTAVLGQYPLPGTFADYICVPFDRVHRSPSHLTAQQAAALPLVGATAWRALMTHAEAAKGHAVLITGIGSVCDAAVFSTNDFS